MTDLKDRLSKNSRGKFFNGLTALLPYSRLELIDKQTNEKMILSLFGEDSIKLDSGDKSKIFDIDNFYYEYLVYLFNDFKSDDVSVVLMDGQFTDEGFSPFEEVTE